MRSNISMNPNQRSVASSISAGEALGISCLTNADTGLDGGMLKPKHALALIKRKCVQVCRSGLDQASSWFRRAHLQRLGFLRSSCKRSSLVHLNCRSTFQIELPNPTPAFYLAHFP